MARKLLSSLIGEEEARSDAAQLRNPARTTLGSFGAVGALRRNLLQRPLGETAVGQVVEVDASSVDSSFISDRLGGDDVSYASLKASIHAQGQQSPVLLRPSIENTGRYQVAFGHRRVRIARELGRPVRAIIQDLTDEQLVLQQGQENSAREDLSMIERACFAFQLEDKGFSREVIIAALCLDRTEVGRLLAIHRAIGNELIRAIGRAPKIGRQRWQLLAERLQDPRNRLRAEQCLGREAFGALGSNERFEAVLSETRAARPEKQDPCIIEEGGRRLATIRTTSKTVQVNIEKVAQVEALQEFLASKLRDLLREFERVQADGQDPKTKTG